MAYQALGLGSTANDGTGDSLRTGGDKINDNFVEIYTKLGDGSTLTADTVTLLTATQTLTNKTLTSPTITGTGAIAGTFTGNITGNVTGNADTATTLATARTIAGVSFNGSANITIASTDLSDTAAIVLATATQTLSGKTLTAPIVGGDVTTASGNLSLNSATQIVEVKGDGSSVEGQIKLNCHANSHGQTIKPQPHSASVTNTSLLPAGASSTLVSRVSVDTLTNKTLTSPTITGTGAIAGASFTASNHVQLAVHATTTARDSAISSPAAGMMIYLTATNKAQVYNGTAWTDLH